MDLVQVKGPKTQLIAISQVKSILRLEADKHDDDELLVSICATATDLVQRCVGRSFLRQTWLVTHRNHRFTLPMWPILSVTKVRRRRVDLKQAIHDGPVKLDEYRIDSPLGQMGAGFLQPTVIDTVFAYSSPKLSVTYEAGFGDSPDDVPDHYKFAVLRGAVWLYRNIMQEIAWTPEAFALHCLGEGQVPAAPISPSLSVVGAKKSRHGDDE
jgi:uncharacterized phiE125 gp8 family phage protein